ncbi:MAG: NYN domain-containing protein [Defluviitaleaceae bacterium]|nr:NYN domain-containing protein [Defluviitaleaceae bacterium]
MLCNTAIFYDIENLLGIFSGKVKTVLNLDEIYRRVLETEGVHGVSIQKAYADWALIPNRALRDSILQVGIEPIQIFNTNQNDRVKNAADVSLIIDVVELITKRPEIENYVIASGDGIFAFLSKKLHEHGKRVIGCGFDRNASNTFRYSCDYYISLEKSDKSLVATTSSRKKSRAIDTVLVSDTPQPTKVPSKFPKTKYSEMLVNANIPVWRDINDISGSLHTVRKLIQALFVEDTEGLPDLEISVFKNYVAHYIPDFKVTKFSFTRFAEFLRFILTGSPCCLYIVDESVYKIARRNTEIKNGIMLEDTKGLLVTAEDGSRYNSIFSVPTDMAFIYTITPEPTVKIEKKKAAPDAPKRGRRKKSDQAVQPTRSGKHNNDAPNPADVDATSIPDTLPPPILPETEIVMDEGSFRKWIKGRFMALANVDALTANETRQLMTPEYSRSTFGIKTPILREIESRSNLLEQRSVNGKVKYWKETYKFNGKHYLVYKDWVANLHRDRFITWLRGMGSVALGE